jgi:hypothetical protein
MSVDDLIARMHARRQEVARFVAQHDGEAFETVGRDGHPMVGRKIIVHHDARGWRLTHFDRRGPTGHVYGRDYADVVKMALVDWGADLSKAKFVSRR